MTRKEIEHILTRMNDRDLRTLIAMANAEERIRLNEAHRAIVRRDHFCLLNHSECRAMLEA